MFQTQFIFPEFQVFIEIEQICRKRIKENDPTPPIKDASVFLDFLLIATPL